MYTINTVEDQGFQTGYLTIIIKRLFFISERKQNKKKNFSINPSVALAGSERRTEIKTEVHYFFFLVGAVERERGRGRVCEKL